MACAARPWPASAGRAVHSRREVLLSTTELLLAMGELHTLESQAAVEAMVAEAAQNDLLEPLMLEAVRLMLASARRMDGGRD